MSMSSPSAGPVLFGFLGATDYVAVHYRLGDAVSPSPEVYVQAAICQLAPECPGRAIIAVTEAARKRHGAGLEQRLGALGVPVEFIDIKDGQSEEELWEIFQSISAKIPAGSRLIFDPTHGFRSLPLLGLLAVQFLRHTRDVLLEAAYYGAFEKLGPPSIVKEKVARNEDPGAAPLLDLTPLVDLPSWTEAVASWEATGRPEQLVEVTHPYTTGIKHNLRKEAPGALVALPKALQLLNNALRLTHHSQTASAAERIVGLLAEASQQLRGHPRLAPLGSTLERLSSTVAPLATRIDESLGEASPAYLEHQLALARWYNDHGDPLQAMIILREALASCAVWCCAIEAAERNPGAKMPVGWSLLREELLRVATREQGKPGRPEEPSCAALWDWLDRHPALEEQFRRAELACRQGRNKLSHAWTGKEHSKEKLIENSLQKYGQIASNGLEELNALVREIVSLAASAGVGREAHEEARPRVFINLSNHAVATWSPEQLQAARALGLGEPADASAPMPMVSPEASEEEVVAMASDLAAEALRSGATGAHVSGEYTLTMALVRALQAGGVACYAATTRRETREEQLPGGQVRREHLFRFVAWRRYAG